jgi:glucosamine--fructose-6-phosphate aminotransferase (isomerizing)
VSSVYRVRQRLDGALFLAISQSGRSPDLLACAEMAREGGALVVALVNDEASPLATLAELCLPLHAGAERSVAATKSYLAALAALLQITAHWAEQAALMAALERLPGWLAAALEQDWNAALEPLAAASDLLVVGRGLGFGIAQEAALKLKETAALHAEAFSAAEILHGPLEIVREGYPVLAFSQEDATRDSVRSLVGQLRDKGASVLVAEEGEPAVGRLPVPSGMDPACALLAMIESFYVLANALAIRRGRNPDAPLHLKKVTETR